MGWESGCRAPSPNPRPQGEGGVNVVRSGRAGGGELRERRRWAPGGAVPRGGGNWKRLVKDVFHQVGEAAVLSDDDDLQFPPQGVAGQDAEVAADVGDDGADRLTADFCGDLLRGGQVGEPSAGFAGDGRGGWAGCARPGLGHSALGCGVQAVGVAEEPRFERIGAVQAAGDAREDQRHIGGAEAATDDDGVGEGAAADCGGEFAAVVDQLSDEAEQVGRAAGLGGWIRGVGRG
jgi:hypothetical protein